MSTSTFAAEKYRTVILCKRPLPPGAADMNLEVKVQLGVQTRSTRVVVIETGYLGEQVLASQIVEGDLRLYFDTRAKKTKIKYEGNGIGLKLNASRDHDGELKIEGPAELELYVGRGPAMMALLESKLSCKSVKGVF
jgi:hypothetical protein